MRVNAVDSPFFHDDMRALLDAPVLPDAIVVPKVDGMEHLHAAHVHLEAAGEKAAAVRLVAMVETPMGLMNLSNTLSASDRLDVSTVSTSRQFSLTKYKLPIHTVQQRSHSSAASPAQPQQRQ